MPLTPGSDKKTVSNNIREMIAAGHPRDQAVAAALSTARKPRAHGGALRPKRIKMHVGPIHSSVAGRTDHLPMRVPSGSYVIPADIISAMGEGNTIAGFKHLRRMFAGLPYHGGALPYGQRGGPYLVGKAEGGEVGSVPIVAAGGEYVVSPEDVLKVGEGDLDRGHRVLDQFVKRMRKKTVETLRALPGPKVD